MSSEVITVNDIKALFGTRPQLGLPQVTGGKVGEIIMFSGSNEPQDWLFCDGRAISRQTYEELFSVIGTTYGAGDGSTTFNIPDFKGRFPIGVGAISPGDSAAENYWGGATAGSVNVPLGQRAGEAWHTLTAAQSGSPAHAHTISHTHGVGSGRHFVTRTDNSAGIGESRAASGTAFYAPSIASADNWWGSASTTTQSTTSSGNNTAADATTAHNNMTPFIGINFIICFKARAASPIDYIVEQGTDGIWTYTKWNNGSYEAVYVGNVNMQAGSAMGGGYFHQTTSALTPPSFSQTVQSLHGAANGGVLFSYVGHANDYSTYWWNASSTAVNNVAVRLEMHGTWK